MLNGTKLAIQNGFKINPVVFRYSTSEYNFDRNDNTIYKGVKSVKGLGKESGDAIYKIRNNKYDTFSELLFDMVTNVKVNQGKIRTLVKLNYFIEFGKMRKLLKILDMFFGDKEGLMYKKNQYCKKTAKKDNLPFDEEIIKKYSKKETPKQYSLENFVGVIGELEKTIPDEGCTVKERAQWQIDFIGYVDIIDTSDPDKCVVISKSENQWNTIVDLYNLAKGTTVKFKLRNRNKIENFSAGDIMNVRSYEQKLRVTPRRDEKGDIIRNPRNGKPKYYDETDKLEWILNSYFMEVF